MADKYEALERKIDSLTKAVEKKQLEVADRPRGSTSDLLNGDGSAPFVTTGPVGKSSAGFRLTKAIAAKRGLIDESDAKYDLEGARLFTKALRDAQWIPDSVNARSIMLPFGSELLPERVTGQNDYKVFKSMWAAGTQGFDLGEVEWLAKSLPEGSTFKKTAMSYLADGIGGTLIAPPVQGELIELVRPREALQNAGVTRVPLPPNGRMVYPRQTGPTSMYWVGENISITESNPTTGQIAMMGKKGGVYVTVPNELLKYSSVAADTLIRNDAAKTLAAEGIEAEVIDLRTLRPLDTAKVLASLKKTNRMVVVEEGWPVCSISSEIIAVAMEQGFDDLDAPVLRVTNVDVPLPYAANLEKLALLKAEDVVTAAKKVCYK
jgi:hypothetical protein